MISERSHEGRSGAAASFHTLSILRKISPEKIEHLVTQAL